MQFGSDVISLSFASFATPAVLRKRANIKEEVYSLETDYEYPNSDADFYPNPDQQPGPVRVGLQKAPDGSYLYTILNER
ncbi:hypothetical protein CHS0354_010316 [Potamilus streckersoni]|uniref:Uncharacterized protein n=1 Tax=Potamilus streckersoni TaxID=2493646 RepID=A0AAE0TEY0_9BIVA|nr:hypothetical protein CHS0354_010316 [Potamilus streckersoni]